MQLGNPRDKNLEKNPRDGYGPQSLASLQPGNIYHTPAQQLLSKHGLPCPEPGLSSSRRLRDGRLVPDGQSQRGAPSPAAGQWKNPRSLEAHRRRQQGPAAPSP